MPSRIRNKIIFLTCLFAFAGLGFVLYREWVVQKPFAVILIIAENFAPSHLSSARLFTGGADFRFRMESMPRTALSTARAADYAVADNAAAASALATGQRVNRGSLALSPEGQTLETLLVAARQAGRATGLVSDTPLTDAATAAFFARASDTRDPAALAVQLMEDGAPDVMLAGGGALLTPEAQGGARRDGRDLLLEMRQRGFDIVRNKAELENTPGWRAPKLFGVFAEGDLAFAEDQSRYPTQPRLADLVRRGIELLQFNRKGYLLVVHAGLAGRAAELGRGETLLRQYAEIDAAIATALDYAGEKSLIVVSGLANTGGLRLNAFSFAPDRGIAVLGPSTAGVPALTWSTGPGTPSTEPGSAILQAVAAQTDRPQPVAEDVLVLASGPGSEKIPNFPDLTDLHAILKQGL
jgi:alkaline phosphatase